jgi:hypothetical protein
MINFKFKKICLLLLVINLLNINIINSLELKTEKDFINFAIESDKILMSIYFMYNPDIIKQYKLKQINKNITQKELFTIMNENFTLDFTKTVWEEGNKYYPKLPFGFSDEKDLGLLEANEIKYTKESDNKIIVTGKVEYINLKGYQYRDMIIILEGKLWKISNINYRKISKATG